MRSQIKAAGDYLLSVLKAEKDVVYSRFYNAELGTDVALVHGMWPFLMSQPVQHRGELDESDKERLLAEAHLLLEWAAWQLVDPGAVKITTLKGSKLIDGEPDFRIEPTERGMRFIEEGGTFGNREPENTRFNVSEASRWMLSFLQKGRPGQTLTLRDVMDPAYNLFSVTMVTDDCGQALLAFVAQVFTEFVALKTRVEELLTELAALNARVAELLGENAALKAQLEQRTRDAKRQAAPFSKGGSIPDE
jgi:hypothetical protein